MEANVNRLREIADALDDAEGERAVSLILEANEVVSRHIVAHEREDETKVYPGLARYLSDSHGLGAMSRAHRDIIHLGRLLGDRKQTTLWTIASGGQDAETQLGTQKPVECMIRPLLNHTAPGDSIYDPFLGSGTTLISAETTGRICLAVELDPALCRRCRAPLARLHGGQGHAPGRWPHL